MRGPASSAPGIVRERLTLLTRAYCSLCDEMQRSVAPIAALAGTVLDVIDVDIDPALEAAWGAWVPVLFLGAPEAAREICHYHFDAQRLAMALAAAGAAAASAIGQLPDGNDGEGASVVQ
ncbi:MAG: glutaredoxin family protein [Betaproteobacteria bacterium]